MHDVFSGVIWCGCTDVAWSRLQGRRAWTKVKDEGVVMDFDYHVRAVRISGSTSVEANYKEE